MLVKQGECASPNLHQDGGALGSIGVATSRGYDPV
jgi:hypothetical protein